MLHHLVRFRVVLIVFLLLFMDSPFAAAGAATGRCRGRRTRPPPPSRAE